MKALDPSSTALLEQAALTLGGTERARAVLQSVYDIGRIDGQLEQATHVEEVLGIEATVTRPRRAVA